MLRDLGEMSKSVFKFKGVSKGAKDLPFPREPFVPGDQEELEKAKECQAKLWELIKSEGDLIIPKEEYFLMRFVRSRKYNPELSYQNLKKYYEARLKYPKSFANFYPSHYKHVFDSGAIQLLKHRDEFGRRTFVLRTYKWNPEITIEDMSMAGLLVAEHMSRCPINQCVGAVIIMDESGMNLGHMRQMTLPAMHKVVMMFQECFPGRYKALHLVNQPYILDLLCTLVKKIISKRLVSRVHLHRDPTSLPKHVSPEILPVSLGGLLPDEEAFDDQFVPDMMLHDEEYKALTNYGFR